MKWCKGSVLTLFFSFVILSCAKGNQCPGGKTSCPDDSTCCSLHNGSFGCCPIKNAVCCQDSVHCCPGGYTCDIIKGVCQMGDKSKPLLEKIPAMPTLVCSWFIFLVSYYNLFILLEVWACKVYLFSFSHTPDCYQGRAIHLEKIGFLHPTELVWKFYCSSKD